MKNLRISLFIFFIVVPFFACSNGSNINPEITEGELAGHIKTLSSDEFGGRAPGTPGGEKAVEYIKQHFEKVGLSPANEGSWYQQVPLVTITLEPETPVTFEGIGEPVTLRNGDKAVMWTMRVQDSVSLENSEMVFVGYGIVAPEYNWNDYEGLDVEGKTVVILVNDPRLRYARYRPFYR